MYVHYYNTVCTCIITIQYVTLHYCIYMYMYYCAYDGWWGYACVPFGGEGTGRVGGGRGQGREGWVVVGMVLIPVWNDNMF